MNAEPLESRRVSRGLCGNQRNAAERARNQPRPSMQTRRALRQFGVDDRDRHAVARSGQQMVRPQIGFDDDDEIGTQRPHEPALNPGKVEREAEYRVPRVGEPGRSERHRAVWQIGNNAAGCVRTSAENRC